MSSKDFALEVLTEKLTAVTHARNKAVVKQEMHQLDIECYRQQQLESEEEIASLTKAIAMLTTSENVTETAAQAFAAADSLRSQ